MNILSNKLSVNVPATNTNLNEIKSMNTNTTTTLLSQVIEQLEQKMFCDLVMDYNAMANDLGYELIHDNDETVINDLYDSPYDAIQAAMYGDYRLNDDYFTFNGYANLVSFSYQLTQDDNCPIDISELAQWIIDNESYSEYDLDIMTIDDLLASIEDNITDDEEMLKVAINFNGIGTMTDPDYVNMSYNEYLIQKVMNDLKGGDYEYVKATYDRLGINY